MARRDMRFFVFTPERCRAQVAIGTDHDPLVESEN